MSLWSAQAFEAFGAQGGVVAFRSAWSVWVYSGCVILLLFSTVLFMRSVRSTLLLAVVVLSLALSSCSGSTEVVNPSARDGVREDTSGVAAAPDGGALSTVEILKWAGSTVGAPVGKWAAQTVLEGAGFGSLASLVGLGESSDAQILGELKEIRQELVAIKAELTVIEKQLEAIGQELAAVQCDAHVQPMANEISRVLKPTWEQYTLLAEIDKPQASDVDRFLKLAEGIPGSLEVIRDNMLGTGQAQGRSALKLCADEIYEKAETKGEWEPKLSEENPGELNNNPQATMWAFYQYYFVWQTQAAAMLGDSILHEAVQDAKDQKNWWQKIFGGKFKPADIGKLCTRKTLSHSATKNASSKGVGSVEGSCLRLKKASEASVQALNAQMNTLGVTYAMVNDNMVSSLYSKRPQATVISIDQYPHDGCTLPLTSVDKPCGGTIGFGDEPLPVSKYAGLDGWKAMSSFANLPKDAENKENKIVYESSPMSSLPFDGSFTLIDFKQKAYCAAELSLMTDKGCWEMAGSAINYDATHRTFSRADLNYSNPDFWNIGGTVPLPTFKIPARNLDVKPGWMTGVSQYRWPIVEPGEACKDKESATRTFSKQTVTVLCGSMWDSLVKESLGVDKLPSST